MTFVARTCPSYTDIAANRARNNIQESLKDLGADTLYNGGDAVSPAVEQAQQPNCTPLPDWRFTHGQGHTGRAPSPGRGARCRSSRARSRATSSRSTSTPLLDRNGDDTGRDAGRRRDGPLTRGARSRWPRRPTRCGRRAARRPIPVLRRAVPGRSSASARCAARVDVLNGDNVEWIGYPTGAKHVFCYAYYVVPPPTSGTIVVRKVVDDSGGHRPRSRSASRATSPTRPTSSFAIAASAR